VQKLKRLVHESDEDDGDDEECEWYESDRDDGDYEEYEWYKDEEEKGPGDEVDVENDGVSENVLISNFVRIRTMYILV
jgi:hypothetical protein